MLLSLTVVNNIEEVTATAEVIWKCDSTLNTDKNRMWLSTYQISDTPYYHQINVTVVNQR